MPVCLYIKLGGKKMSRRKELRNMGFRLGDHREKISKKR
jgi:hypothetical protein